MRRVVLIEDEAALRASLVRGLGADPELHVVGAGTFAEGMQLIDSTTPDLVLSDLNLPDRSGIELVGELGKRKLHIPVVFMSAYLSDYCNQIPRNAGIEVVEKPVSLSDLREVLHAQLSRTRYSPFSVADYLQLASMGRHSVCIIVHDCHAERQGEIVIVDGQLWSAQDEEGDGSAAFQRLVLAPSTNIVCEGLGQEHGSKEISADLQGLLLDALRTKDEHGREEASKTAIAGPNDQSAGEEPSVTQTPEESSVDSSALLVQDDEAVIGVDALPATTEPTDRTATEAAIEATALEGILAEAGEAILDNAYPLAFNLLLAAKQIAPNHAQVIMNLNRLTELGYTPTEED